MESTSHVRFVWIVVVAAVICAAWLFVKRQGFAAGSTGSPVKQSAAKGAEEGVKILEFYPREAVLTEGDKTVLCYGVTNAKSVRIDPHVEGVSPSLTRCVEVRPSDTRYTLIAEGADGRSVSQSFNVQVAADTTTLPRITSFHIVSCSKDYTGEPVFSLSFADQNAEEVSIDPPVFQPLHRSAMGQFYVRPGKTTTYTLSVAGKNGHVARQQLTVDVGQCK